MKPTVALLFSGGLDSVVLLAKALEDGRRVTPIFFSYGQLQEDREYRAVWDIYSYYEEKGKKDLEPVTRFSFELPIKSALMGNQAMPEDRTGDSIMQAIASVYVPCRNAIMLTMATAFAESYGIDEVWTALTYTAASGVPTPDARPEFLKALELALMLGSKTGVEQRRSIPIVAPFHQYMKEDVVREALERKERVPMHLSWSCYQPKGTRPCGKCDACVIRAEAFRAFSLPDPSLVGEKLFWTAVRSR